MDNIIQGLVQDDWVRDNSKQVDRIEVNYCFGKNLEEFHPQKWKKF